MKQLQQNFSIGDTTIVDANFNRKNSLLVRSFLSLISAGTDRMLVEFDKANFIEKAHKQPEKLKMVLEKVQSDCLISTNVARHRVLRSI